MRETRERDPTRPKKQTQTLARRDASNAIERDQKRRLRDNIFVYYRPYWSIYHHGFSSHKV